MERLPGFRDFYPAPCPTAEAWSAELRQHIFNVWRRTALCYGFREYDGPPLEPLELYTAKSGAEIVNQLYNFTDKGAREVALRPEMTPTLARMVAAHARQYKKPIKWFALPQLFRYERQQKGRLREHFQFNADIVGEADPAADAELIALLVDTLRGFGLKSDDFVVRLSSRNAWSEFLQRHCREGAPAYEFYQAVDKLDRETEEASDSRLGALGTSLDEVRGFIARAEPTPELGGILENLRRRGLGDFVRVDYGVIRGLAYYTGPVFEAFDIRGEFRAIAGGGRYDHLIRLVSGGKVDLPALGFGMGDVVLAELLRDRSLVRPGNEGIDVFWLIEDEALRADSLGMIQRLRERGCRVDYALTATKPDRQFKRALELEARFAACLVGEAGQAMQVRLKDLRTRTETLLAPEACLERLGVAG